ncbi:hypothetical protein N2152v2_009680 [Parachlorella kessleri]
MILSSIHHRSQAVPSQRRASPWRVLPFNKPASVLPAAVATRLTRSSRPHRPAAPRHRVLAQQQQQQQQAGGASSTTLPAGSGVGSAPPGVPATKAPAAADAAAAPAAAAGAGSGAAPPLTQAAVATLAWGGQAPVAFLAGTGPSPDNPFGYIGLPTPAVAKQLGLSEAHLQRLVELPGTETMLDLKERLGALAQWNSLLKKGILPHAGDLSWPAEPFRSKFIGAMKRLEMARFTRRYPQLLGPLLREFLNMVKDFEAELKAAQQQQQQQQPQGQGGGQPQQSGQQQQAQQQQQQEGQGSEGGGESEQMEAAEGQDGSGESKDSKEIQVSLEDLEGGEAQQAQQAQQGEGQQGQEGEPPLTAEQVEALFEERVDKLLQRFEEQWSPAMENLEAAAHAFDDVGALLEGPEGFDASKGLWRSSGWRDIDSLRRKLETLKELRELVRSLGRGGGKGPLKKAPEECQRELRELRELVRSLGRAGGKGPLKKAPEEVSNMLCKRHLRELRELVRSLGRGSGKGPLKAPEEVYSSHHPLGVIRSPQSPEETRGLTRSGDLSRMLPLEAHLLAAGWPRRAAMPAGDLDETAARLGASQTATSVNGRHNGSKPGNTPRAGNDTASSSGAGQGSAATSASPSSAATSSAPSSETAQSRAPTAAAALPPPPREKPKGARTAYMFYASAVREQVKRENPRVSAAQVTKLIGERWKALGKAARRPYQEQADQDKVRAVRELAAWQQASLSPSTPDPAAAAAAGSQQVETPPAAAQESQPAAAAAAQESLSAAGAAAEGATLPPAGGAEPAAAATAASASYDDGSLLFTADALQAVSFEQLLPAVSSQDSTDGSVQPSEGASRATNGATAGGATAGGAAGGKGAPEGGWEGQEGEQLAGPGGGGELASGGDEDGDGGGGGSRACRLLFMARRAERQLMSYERTGWVDDEPSRLTGRREIRPAAELGPIIVCLDTSGPMYSSREVVANADDPGKRSMHGAREVVAKAVTLEITSGKSMWKTPTCLLALQGPWSMYGAREVVAKAVTLECMRGAHRQQRRCYIYAFSGPGQVQELEVGTDPASMQRLLGFLTMAFNGGTDVDAPLALSLTRITQEDCQLAYILIVTDGEVPPCVPDVMAKLTRPLAPLVSLQEDWQLADILIVTDGEVPPCVPDVMAKLTRPLAPLVSLQEDWQLADILIVTDGEVPPCGPDVMAKLTRPLAPLVSLQEDWQLADILIVTDGEVPPCGPDVMAKLEDAEQRLGLEVHGLLVGRKVTATMEDLCTHIHVFKSWTAVGAEHGGYYSTITW